MSFIEEHDRTAARIAAAPVEPWLKEEALSDLQALREAHTLQIAQLHASYSEPAKVDHEFEGVWLNEAELASEDAKEAMQAPVDHSWRRMQIIELITRGASRRLGTDELIRQAEAVEEWVSGS